MPIRKRRSRVPASVFWRLPSVPFGPTSNVPVRERDADGLFYCSSAFGMKLTARLQRVFVEARVIADTDKVMVSAKRLGDVSPEISADSDARGEAGIARSLAVRAIIELGARSSAHCGSASLRVGSLSSRNAGMR